MDVFVLQKLLQSVRESAPSEALLESLRDAVGAARIEFRVNDLTHPMGESIVASGIRPSIDSERLDFALPAGATLTAYARDDQRFTEEETVYLEVGATLLGQRLLVQRAQADLEVCSQSRLSFLSNLSHELRTPLNGILGFSHLLNNSALNDDQRAMVQTIGQSGQRLLSTVGNILELAQFETGLFRLETTPFSPVAVLASAMAPYQLQSQEKGLEWIHGFSNEIPAILDGDPVRLGQAWGHVFSNAVKFTRAGQVRVTLAADERPEKRYQLTLTVTDTGIGLNGDSTNPWFEPFRQADASMTRTYGGTGLGLALCDRLAKSMDGGVSLGSGDHQGTVVKVWVVLGLRDTGGEL